MALVLGKKYKRVYNDVMGEFGTRQMLLEFLDEMEDADDEHLSKGPPGWDGDRIALYHDEKKGHSVLIWKTVWDSEKDVQEFYECIKFYYKKRLKPTTVKTKGEGETLLKNGKQHIYIRIRGLNIWVVDGIKSKSMIKKIEKKTNFFEMTKKLVK